MLVLSTAVMIAAMLGLSTPAAAAGPLSISTLSTKAQLVSGSEVLARVDVAPGIPLGEVAVSLNGDDVSGAFHPTSGHTLTGLVTGLRTGRNSLRAAAPGAGEANLTVTDHPITGPVFAGPKQEPFVCETQAFALPGGGTLGAPLDENCSAQTQVEYIYKSTDGTFKPLPDPSARPADLAQTTTSTGLTVDYVVRVETGTINRAIYQIAVLDDPTVDSEPTWDQHPRGWNGRLVYSFGGGLAPGYHQGSSIGVGGNPLNDLWLSRGYAAASSSLNVFWTDADPVLSAETTMMVKEHFIDEFGVPTHTIGWGESGGSMQQQLIAQNYPGLLDGIIPQLSFPDTITFFTQNSDCQLLNQAFASSSLSWTTAQKAAVEGFGSPDFCTTALSSDWRALLTAGVDPSFLFAGCNPPFLGPPVVPPAEIYDPVTNPNGVRCDYYDSMVNVFGRDPRTGFARRTIDNVGVQYGLQAFRAGQIDAEQFLDLNQRVGGYDVDGNIVPSRSVADPRALRIAYQTGQVDEAGGGLDAVPIIDLRSYRDAIADPHDAVHSLIMRARLIAANGTAANQVILTGPPQVGFANAPAYADIEATALEEMNRWLDDIAGDHASAPSTLEKVVRDKPSDLVDACYTETGTKVTDPGLCQQMYPVHSNPRLQAGEPLANDYLKCQLRPIRRSDYPPMTDAQLARLRGVFPNGACDYSRDPVGLVPLKNTWLSYPRPGTSVPLRVERATDGGA
jgi:hypothetical protein